MLKEKASIPEPPPPRASGRRLPVVLLSNVGRGGWCLFGSCQSCTLLHLIYGAELKGIISEEPLHLQPPSSDVSPGGITNPTRPQKRFPQPA